MSDALREAVASSTAHGLSKAAGDKPKPLKVMWILLFLTFLALFCRSGFNLVMKLTDNRLTKNYHLDQVQFVFPDLYFCPSNAYSGSYPFLLKKREADLINENILQILKKLKVLYDAPEFDLFRTEPNQSVEHSAPVKAAYVQASLPFHLMARYLVQRKDQAVLQATLTSNYVSSRVSLGTFHHPENIVCFKVLLTAEQKRKMQAGNSDLEIWLTTDPYFSDLNFTGHPIKPIVDGTNRSVPFLSWHPISIVEQLKKSGFTMLIVPSGAYPSLKFEKNFHLAPGNAYSVKVEMVENACSEDLHKTHCVANQSKVGFVNPLTGQRVPFNYSSAACYYQRRNRKFIDLFGCQLSMHPLLWENRSRPRCLNVSEVTSDIMFKMHSTLKMDLLIEIQADATGYCKNRIPCSYPQYGASFSFSKWPSVGSSTANFFANDVYIDQKEMPGLAKLAMIAQQMQSGNHSAHLEGIFRSYVSEAMLSVSISAASVVSSQVVLTWSYTMTDFLADTGGLLGLYIGCSLLTLCELLELFYVLVDLVCKRKSQPTAASGDAEVAGDDIEEEVTSPVETVQKI